MFIKERLYLNNKELKNKILNYFNNDVIYNEGFDLFKFIETLSDDECDSILDIFNDDVNE